MSKQKVMFKAKGAVNRATEHLRLYGMSNGVDSANEIVYDLISWAYDVGHGDDRPCPVDEDDIKRRVRW